MELFAAGDEEQLAVVRRWIDESDVFMLLLGKRYGSIEPRSGLSYIEVEYEHAVKASKPLFAIILTEALAEMKVRRGVPRAAVYEQQYRAALARFEDTVRSRMCTYADDLKDIKLGVADSLRTIESRHDLTGWIHSRDIPRGPSTIFPNLNAPDYKSELDESLRLAKSIDVIGIGNNALTQERTVEFYRAFVARGGRMRALFLSPSGEAIREREVEEQRKFGSLTYNVVHNVEDTRRFVAECDQLGASSSDAIEVRFYDRPPKLNMTLIDGSVAFVHYYGSRDRGQDSPCFFTRDAEVLPYYLNEFNRLWLSAEAWEWSAWDEFLKGP
jgi:hypothetical protein